MKSDELEDPFPSETDDNETPDGIIPHQVESIWDAICLNAFDSEALIGIQRLAASIMRRSKSYDDIVSKIMYYFNFDKYCAKEIADYRYILLGLTDKKNLF